MRKRENGGLIIPIDEVMGKRVDLLKAQIESQGGKEISRADAIARHLDDTLPHVSEPTKNDVSEQ